MEVPNETLDNLNGEALQNKLVEVNITINDLKAQKELVAMQLRDAAGVQDRIKRILHIRSLQESRWCKIDSWKSQNILRDVTHQSVSIYESWAYIQEKLDNGNCRIILVVKGWISLCRVREIVLQNLNDKTLRKEKGSRDIAWRNDFYYALPVVIPSTTLEDASLEAVMTQSHLFGLVQHSIPRFTRGLAAYAYADKQWYRIRTRYQQSNGIPVFIRTSD